MPTKSSYEKIIEKQMKETKKQAEEAARRERAKSIIEGQPFKNGLRILDGNAEQFLKIILDTYDGNEKNHVVGDISVIPENIYYSLNLELEKLMMYGVATNAHCSVSGRWELFLTPQGKSYFKDKITAEDVPQKSEVVMRKQYDVFISHANKDKLDYVDALYSAIKRLGVTIFYDSEEISWGDNWKEVILQGVEKSEFAIVVISERFFGREWTERELNELLQRQNENGQKIILPLLHGLSFNDLKGKYPELEFIQSISSEKPAEEIVILLAKELIKRYK